VAAELLRSGALTPEEAARHPGRHVVVRSIGAEETASADVTAVTLHPDEAIVVVSDGVSDVLDPPVVHELIVGAQTAAEAARRLVAAALRHGASDNVTAAVVRHMASSADGSPGRGDSRAG